MSDIVRVLRGKCGLDYDEKTLDQFCNEAADEIEKLRAALRRIIDRSTETFYISPKGGANIVVEGHDRFAFEVDVKALLNIARAALGEKE
jgi:hypothetical protein